MKNSFAKEHRFPNVCITIAIYYCTYDSLYCAVHLTLLLEAAVIRIHPLPELLQYESLQFPDWDQGVPRSAAD